MAKRYHFLAVVALLSIVVVTLLGPMAAFSINPEIAAAHANYARNFRLLEYAKNGVLLATALIDFSLWLMCCAFLIKAKARSHGWLPLALLGPYGLAVITMLEDRSPDGRDVNRVFIGKMRPLTRIAYEIVIFVAIGLAAFVAIVLWSGLSIEVESMRTGDAVAAILERRNASSGMWAFGDELRELYLVALLYLARPFSFRALGWFGKSFFPSRRE